MEHVCKHCGKPVIFLPNIQIPSLNWMHATGFYGCNESRPSHSTTYAEPAEVEGGAQ